MRHPPYVRILCSGGTEAPIRAIEVVPSREYVTLGVFSRHEGNVPDTKLAEIVLSRDQESLLSCSLRRRRV